MTPGQVPAITIVIIFIIIMLIWASILSRIWREESSGRDKQQHGKSFCWAEWSYQHIRCSIRNQERWPHSDNFRLSHAGKTETTLAPELFPIIAVQSCPSQNTLWCSCRLKSGDLLNVSVKGRVFGEWALMEKQTELSTHAQAFHQHVTRFIVLFVLL